MIELDQEIIQELIDSFHEHYETVEEELQAILVDPTDERLNSLFRAIHNIKGHAAMFEFQGIVDFTHVIEDIADRLRARTLQPNPDLCECLLLGMDRLRDLHFRDILHQDFPILDEVAIRNQFRIIAKQPDDNLQDDLSRLLSLLSGGYSDVASDNQSLDLFSPPPLPTGHERLFLDLAFFQEISFQLDSHNPDHIGRSIQFYDLAQKLNHISGNKVDYHQLAAATYMHDVGMSFLAKDIANKSGGMTTNEQSEWERHVSWSYDLLIRMPGWEEAALIILNHHERIDGKGFPNKLNGSLIHPGAKILAILDAFFSMMTTEVNRTQRKSLLRAMAEINALKGTQFDSDYVDYFNQLIKLEAKQGRL